MASSQWPSVALQTPKKFLLSFTTTTRDIRLLNYITTRSTYLKRHAGWPDEIKNLLNHHKITKNNTATQNGRRNMPRTHTELPVRCTFRPRNSQSLFTPWSSGGNAANESLPPSENQTGRFDLKKRPTTKVNGILRGQPTSNNSHRSTCTCSWRAQTF